MKLIKAPINIIITIYLYSLIIVPRLKSSRFYVLLFVLHFDIPVHEFCRDAKLPCAKNIRTWKQCTLQYAYHYNTTRQLLSRQKSVLTAAGAQLAMTST